MKFFLLTCVIFLSLTDLAAQQPRVGIARDMEDDSVLYASGYRYFVESIGKIMDPQKISDEQWAENLAAIKRLKTSLYAVNIFIPGNLKTVGPAVDEAAILAYTAKVFERCRQAGVGMVVWGSGGSRRLPEGWDYADGVRQFTSIAKKIAVQAQQYDIELTLENLNSGETNFLTKLSEVIEVVKDVNEPNLNVCVDIYHMLRENEPPAVIVQGGDLIRHCDIAEKENRTAPGTVGDEVVPYLAALKEINFKDVIIIEGRWTNFEQEAPKTFSYLEGKISELWKQGTRKK